MFTVKYRSFALSPIQSSGNLINYDMSEQIHGPFLFVSQEYESGKMVVYAHRDEHAAGFAFGPFVPSELAGDDHPHPTVWVMNEQGATIAKYDL